VTSLDFLTLSDLPAALRGHGVKISYSGAHKLIAEGIVPAARLGSRWVMSRDDLPKMAAAIRLRPRFAKHNALANA